MGAVYGQGCLGAYDRVAVPLTLAPFDAAWGETVLGWVGSPEEADRWASADGRALVPTLLAQWHADPDVHAYVALADERPVGYGEVWHDPAEDEAELARILVDPARRGRGIGRALTAALVERARAAGFADVWLRVVPGNEPALRTYAAAGFVRASADEESAFNQDQPVAYVWMRHRP
jgi:ribosomal protein S18 acetylase RimI-like enzyme